MKILSKEGKIIPLRLNNAQNVLYETIKNNYGKKPTRIVILKARQLGLSTFTEALITQFILTMKHKRALIVAHQSDASNNLFNMTKRYVDNYPDVIKPEQKYSNAKELVFNRPDGNGMDSSIEVKTAGDGVRSSTYHFAHISELGFWKNPTTDLLAINQTIPYDPNTLVVIESTANGYNYFYDFWNKAVNGENDYIPLFFPWYLDQGYTKYYDGFELTDYEIEIKEQYNLTNEQLAWRRWCIANNCNGDEQLFKQEYPISPEEAFITSGDCVFDVENIKNRLRVLKEPIARGYFKYDYDGLKITNIKWCDDPKGYIKIHQKPSNKLNYCIGGDTAGEGSDYFTGQVRDQNGVKVATLRHRLDSDLYTKQMYCLGKYYNYALLTIEVNFDSYPIQELQRLGYNHMYIREVNDTALNKKRKTYGFRTDGWTRPAIINHLIEMVRDHIELFNDKDTLMEMLTFIRTESGKKEAEVGAHDDLVMADAICFEGLTQVVPFKEEKKKGKRNGFDSYWG